MLKGVVRWFRNDLGYGFIDSEDGDVYVHFTAIARAGYRTLYDGQEVEYEAKVGEKGLCANVVVPGAVPPLAQRAW